MLSPYEYQAFPMLKLSVVRSWPLLASSLITGCFAEVSSSGASGFAPEATVVQHDAGWTPIDVPMDVDAALGLDAAAPALDATVSDSAPVELKDAALADTAAPAKDGAPPVPDASPLADTGPSPSDASNSDALVVVDSGPAECSLVGEFSSEVILDVQWKATTVFGVVPVIAAGSGKIRFLMHMASEDGEHFKLRACRGEVPDFAGSFLIDEVYSAHIPDAVWERPTIPSWDLTWNMECRKPGCAMNIEEAVVTLGAITTPGAPWPGRRGPLSTIISADHDNDGAPGATFLMRDAPERSPMGKTYSHPPVSFALQSRASELYLAFQARVPVKAKLSSCDTITGSISQGAVEARAIGCRAQKPMGGPDADCTSEQIDFVDDNLPNWTVMGGGSLRAKRMAPGADCAAIRAAWK